MLPEKTWRPEAVLQLGSGICVCMLLGMLTLGGLDRLLPDLGRGGKNLITFTVGAASFQGAALVWIHFFLRQHGVGWRDAFGLSLEGPALKGAVAWGVLGMIVAFPVVLGLGKAAEVLLVSVGVTPQPQLPVKMLGHQLPPAQLVVYGFGAILLAPIAEEMLFRGILYPTLKQSGYRQAALWVSALLFAATHMNLMAFIPLTFLALVLTWLYEKTTHLLAPILAHLVFNAVNFTLLVVQPSWLKLS